MKTLLIASALILCFSTYATDGAYDCSLSQKTKYNKLAKRVLDADQYIKKAREMSERGNKEILISQLNLASAKLENFSNDIKEVDFCYSFTKQAEYLNLKSKEISLKIKVMKSNFVNVNSCDYSIETIEKNHNKYRELASFKQTSYLEITKSLKQTNLLLASKDCNLEQKQKLFSLFDEQSTTLQSLYKSITKVQ